MKKKLIEVALPLEAINKASAREKVSSQRRRLASTIARVSCYKEFT
jgi:adenine-specific DNA methylase